jgi:hypothetical protein
MLTRLATLQEWDIVRLATPATRHRVLETLRELSPAGQDVVRRILVADEAELDVIEAELGFSADDDDA